MTVSTSVYRDYLFTISHDPDEPGYTVDFLDIPEIITSHDSHAGAFANACEALDLHLESLQRLGLSLPKRRHRIGVETT